MQPAPLYSVAGEAWRGEASWVEAAGGGRLRAALFPAEGVIRGSVIVSPGRTECIEKYAEVVGELQGRGFTTLIHDWRGQGLSQSFARMGLDAEGLRKGHARGWRLFLSDFARLLDVFAERLPRPWVGLGHSMGGALTLLAITEGEARFDAAALSTPMLGLRLGGRSPGLARVVSEGMMLIGRGADATPPATPGGRPASVESRSGETLTHDRERWARYQALLDAAPELRLGQQTWNWLNFALSLTRRLEALRTLEQVAIPVTIVAAEHDRVVTDAAQRAAARRLPLGRYVEVEGAFHELLLETDARRAVFWRAFDELAAGLGA